MSDKELEEKLRWIFEAYGKDLQAFFRDAQKEFNRVKIESKENLTDTSQCETIQIFWT